MPAFIKPSAVELQAIKTTFLLFLLIALSLFVKGQNTSLNVSGQVVASTSKNPIASVTASLLQNDKKLVSTTTDTTGKFVLEPKKPGRYTLEFTSVGYNSRIRLQ